MPICYNFVKELRKKINWVHILVALLFWTCYCYQGDEARPISITHVNPITCHVIFEKTLRRHVTKTCSCKCWIWCKNTIWCKKWNLFTQTQLLQPQPNKQSSIVKALATACSTCCHRDVGSSILYDSPLQHFKCNINPYHPSSSSCDNHNESDSCCSVICSNEQNVGPCLHFYSNESADETTTFREEDDKLQTFYTNERKRYLQRNKRSSEFQLPYHIEALNAQKKFTVYQPFSIKVQLQDQLGSLVPDTGRKVELKIIGYYDGMKHKEQWKTFSTVLKNGTASFSNVSFNQTGNSYRLYVGSYDSSAVLPWTSEKLTVSYRSLSLIPSGRTLPISPRENDTLSPAAGVIIYDVMNQRPANKSYLSQYTWNGTVSLLYDGVYPGKLLGTTTKLVQDGSNEILFNDVVITEWGYSYILKIQIKAKETSYWNLTYILGPFDVDMLDTFEQPLVESDEFREVKIVFDGEYDIVRKDVTKFEIFFLNHFGRTYSRVRWKNVTVVKGSIIVNAVITGLMNDLDMISKSLTEDIEQGKADITYDQYRLKANRIFLPSRKLLEESGTGVESSEDDVGGLSVAWIVAIVVNVLLIVVFIIAIIYCYCRRKKQRENARSSTIQNFDGQNLFANKAENKLQDKATIFTVEDSRIKLEEENEDDPQGYPTPSPEPTFPTPQPSPEPEDYWRPDSFSPPEEEPEEEEMFLPGAVSDPSPEMPPEERFYVYLLTNVDGSRELIGQIYLRVDSFLSETRRAIDRNRDLSEVIESRDYRFLDENLDAVPVFQESSLDLERIFPAQGINIQYIPPRSPTPKLQVPERPRIPAYVGPLGICNAPDCTLAAKLKCLDCRNVAYCSKRCMREDAKDHRRVCYKPAWRL